MIRSLLLPVVLALVVGLAGSAGFAVMSARTSHAAYSIVRDSVERVRADSVAADSLAQAQLLADATALADSIASVDSDSTSNTTLSDGFDTPADSLRAVAAGRAGSAPNSSTRPFNNTNAAATVAINPTTSRIAATTAKDTKDSVAPTAAKVPDAVDAAAAIKAAAELPDDVLPERRLAKIFGAMSARDAAKVLEQMSDADVRTILSMMGDRQAAAVLSSLPATRAAAITKGGARAAGSTTP